jgi:transmembrane sensor
MIKERLFIARLIAAELSGSITEDQLKELDGWRNESEENLNQYKTIKDEFVSGAWETNYQDIDLRSEWLMFKEQKLSQITGWGYFVKNMHRRTIPLPYAAAIVVLIVFSWFTFQPGKQPVYFAETATTIEAPMGSRTHVVLPDGTGIWLNAGSVLTYSRNFNMNTREVALNGEAYFDVQKADLPFIVSTPDLHIRVLGTSFNVKAYEDDDFIETTLVSGSLVIEKGRAGGPGFQNIVLEPNQKAIFFRQEGSIALNQVKHTLAEKEDLDPVRPVRNISRIQIAEKKDVTAEIGWKDGMLLVDREPLETLVRKLERRYDVTFVFREEGLRDYIYSGLLRDLTLEQVMRAMSYTSPIDFDIEDKTVYLSVNPDTRSKYDHFIKNLKR